MKNLKDYDNEYIRERIDPSFERFSKLFVLAYARGDMLLMKIHIGNIFFQDLK